MLLSPDKDQARRFLRALDPTATAFTFQTFDDNSARKDATLAAMLHGTLDKHWVTLCELNARGAGIFVTVQETDGRGRTNANVTRVRALYHDDDGGGINGTVPTPHIVVESSPGKRHSYWLVDLPLEEFGAVQQRLVDTHGSDPRAKDLARVLRLPGTIHRKREPHPVNLLDCRLALIDGPMTAEQARAHFPPVARAPALAPREPGAFDARAVMRALGHVPADDRQTWLEVGMALHHASNGSTEGFALWDTWSRTEARGVYSADEQDRVWSKFASDRPGAATLGKLYYLAGKHGYQHSTVDPVSGFTAVPAAPAEPQKPLLFFVDDIDMPDVIADLEKDLVSGVLPYGEEAVIYGDPGAGKTFVAIELAWCVARGVPWHGRRAKQHPVLYVALEGETGFKLRMRAAELTYGHPGKWFARLNISVTLAKPERGQPDDGKAGFEKIVAACKELEAHCGQPVGLIVLDTLSRSISGNDENAQEFMSHFVDKRMAALRHEIGCTVIAVHHTNKAGTMRGSSVLLGAMNTVLKCERDKPTNVRKITAEKVKDGREQDLFSYRLETVTLGARSTLEEVDSCVIVETDAVTLQQKLGPGLLVATDGGECTVSKAADEIAKDIAFTGVSRTTIRRQIGEAFGAEGTMVCDGVRLEFKQRGSGGTIVRKPNDN